MSHAIPLSIPAFARRQQELLLAEHDAEISSSPFSTAGLISGSPSVRRALQSAGQALTGLILAGLRTGVGGREVGEFSPDPATGSTARGRGESSREDGSGVGNDGGIARLPVHGIRVGDVVRVEDVSSSSRSGGGGQGAKGTKPMEGKAKGSEGVVTRVGERSVWVAFGEGGAGPSRLGQDYEGVGDLWGKRLWMVKLANDITYRRMKQTIAKMERMSESEHTHLMRVLFGHTSPSPLDLKSVGPIEFTDPSLNESQKEAIQFALGSREVALIHGPPGTGKTHTLIELILQLLRRGFRVLVCGPSNISVDNIVERLAPHNIPLVRVGHPARLLSSILDHSLEVLTQTSDAAAIVKDVRREIEQKQASIRKTRSGRERREIYKDLKELRKEFRERESKCVDTLMGESMVVLATLHGAGGHQLRNQKFDIVIIDEASQALEAQCWVPLLSASRVVLAGDHLQLPPTVKSSAVRSKGLTSRGASVDKLRKSVDNEGIKQERLKVEERSGSDKTISLETTLFDRLLFLHGPVIKRMLTTQYRMHERIMWFPSQELYESKLRAAETVKQRLLKDLSYGVEDTDDTREPVVFYDTQGGNFPELSEEETGKPEFLLAESKSNSMEAAIVVGHVEKLVSAGVRPDDIAVVTPYNAQLSLLSQSLKQRYPGIELGTVDGFQGREKEAVIVSLVRSNPDREVGFLGEKRRLNVAMTRPRRHLCVCGDSETIRHGSPFLERWMAFLEENADLRYPNEAEFI